MHKPVPARVAVPRALLAAAAVALTFVLPHLAQAQDRATGVQRVKTIGFTVADVERETNFFANVLPNTPELATLLDSSTVFPSRTTLEPLHIDGLRSRKDSNMPRFKLLK